MKKLVLIAFSLFSLVSCQAQDKIKEKDIETQPKGKWEVHREYDQNGNLVHYDSVYVWSSSNVKTLPKNMDLDSIMQSYKSFFNRNDTMGWQPEFSVFENTDSLFNKNFFDDTFFRDNWRELHEKQFQKMLEKMEKVREEFLENQLKEPSQKNNKQSKTL